MKTTPLTPRQLKKLQSLNKSVTSGRWKLDDLEIAVYQNDIEGDYIGRVSPGYEPVGRLIVAVMNSLPALLTLAQASLSPKSTKQPSRSKLQPAHHVLFVRQTAIPDKPAKKA